MNQHDSRKIAMQAVYLAGQNPDMTIDEVQQNAARVLDIKVVPEYTKTLITGVLSRKAEIDKQISSHLKKGWRLERIDRITLAILEVGIYEMMQQDVIQQKAAINEALNLCDEFADPQSKPFVNGVLGNFIN